MIFGVPKRRGSHIICTCLQLLVSSYRGLDRRRTCMMEAVGKFFEFYRGALTEDTYRELMGKTSEERCGWLASVNRSVLLRDEEWARIYDDIVDNLESFARYYPMVRVSITNRGRGSMVRAFVTNDALYTYASELASRSQG